MISLLYDSRTDEFVLSAVYSNFSQYKRYGSQNFPKTQFKVFLQQQFGKTSPVYLASQLSGLFRASSFFCFWPNFFNACLVSGNVRVWLIVTSITESNDRVKIGKTSAVMQALHRSV